MTIGQYIALRQPNIFKQVMAIRGIKIDTVKEKPRENIKRIMEEVPGFDR